MKKILLILVISFSMGFTTVNTNKKLSNEQPLEIILFNKLNEIKCNDFGSIDALLNSLDGFYMEGKSSDQTMDIYKLKSSYKKYISIGVYIQYKGFRFESISPVIYNYILKNGVFKEKFSKKDFFMLVYKIGNEEYLLKKSYYNGQSYYLVDTYCAYD
jgi:hypothetical protein